MDAGDVSCNAIGRVVRCDNLRRLRESREAALRVVGVEANINEFRLVID